jgi:hypothetical protein
MNIKEGQKTAWKQPGATFSVTMHWRLDVEANIRAWATFRAEVVRADEHMMRLLCKMAALEEISTSHPPEQIEGGWLERIGGLVGKYANLPFEAAEGAKLNLRVETLGGEMTFFFDETSPKMLPKEL